MSSLRIVSAIALCVGLLAACSKPAGGGAASGSASASAPAAAAAPGGNAEISVGELPHVKAGVWVMSDVTEGKTDPSPIRICTLDKPYDLGKMRKMCSKFIIHRTLTGLSIESECGTGKISSTMHGTVSGDFQSNYTSDMKMTVNMPGQPPREIDTTMNYKYAGACTAAELAEAKQDAIDAAKAMDEAAADK